MQVCECPKSILVLPLIFLFTLLCYCQFVYPEAYLSQYTNKIDQKVRDIFLICTNFGPSKKTAALSRFTNVLSYSVLSCSQSPTIQFNIINVNSSDNFTFYIITVRSEVYVCSLRKFSCYYFCCSIQYLFCLNN